MDCRPCVKPTLLSFCTCVDMPFKQNFYKRQKMGLLGKKVQIDFFREGSHATPAEFPAILSVLETASAQREGKKSITHKLCLNDVLSKGYCKILLHLIL